MNTIYRPLLVAFLSLAFCLNASMAQEKSSTTDGEPTQVNQTAQAIDIADGEQQKKLHYWLYLPGDYQPKSAKASDGKQKQWPLMIFLHGMGERGPADGSKLDLVKKWGPPKRVSKQTDFPFVLVSPQCHNTVRGWNPDHLTKLLKSVMDEHNVDPSRVYLTGLSMGGYGTWALAARHPDRFAAAVPVCGGGNPASAEKLKNLPIWAFHGGADRVVPLNQSQKMVDAIKEAGGSKVKLTVYEGVGHNSWTQTYENPKLYEWLLSHRKN